MSARVELVPNNFGPDSPNLCVLARVCVCCVRCVWLSVKVLEPLLVLSKFCLAVNPAEGNSASIVRVAVRQKSICSTCVVPFQTARVGVLPGGGTPDMDDAVDKMS